MEKKKPVKKAPKKTTKPVAKKTTEKKITTKTTKTKKKKKRAFTLIELLAVIIILGILMIIAIPAVTSYISDSRKNAYVDTAKEIVAGTRNIVNEGKLGMYDTGVTYYIPYDYVQMENGKAKSPYGDFTQAYVGVVYNGQGYKYYWISNDDTGQGVNSIVLADELDTDDIKSDLKDDDIETAVQTTGIGQRTKIKIYNVNRSTWDEFDAENNVGEEGGSVDFSANAICRRATELHTTTCGQSWQYGCKGDPAYSTTVTYGTLWDGSSKDTIKPGDAFDCKVRKDGDYTERFYYIGEEGDRVSLIYYANIEKNGSTIVSPSQKNYAYNSTANNNNDGNYKGPKTAVNVMPTIEQWDNLPLIGERTLLNERGGDFVWYDDDYRTKYNISNPYDYGDKVARLLTFQEVQSFVGEGSLDSMGYLNGYSFLFENVGKYTSGMNTGTQGYWVDTPTYSSKSGTWAVFYYRDFSKMASYSGTLVGVRPVIMIPKSKIVK